MWTIFASTCAVAISLLALKYFPIPYLWIFGTWATALFVAAAFDRRRQALWFNVACIAVGLAIFEYYLWTSGLQGFAGRRVYEGNFRERLFHPHGTLGWAPQPGTVANERLSFEGQLIYDATYTIGPNGLRISSPSADDHNSSSQCILFFGDSFTFGEGVEDHETLPFQVSAKALDRYRTYNFGVMGYGPHQMLSALQHGLVDDAVQCDRAQISHVFYQGITDHVGRSAGLVWWNKRRGPRYVLTPDGAVRLEGNFEDDDDFRKDKSLNQMFWTQIAKSMLYRSIIQGKYIHRYSRENIDLYSAIIAEAQRVVRADFPHAEFHVLWWDEDDIDNEAIKGGLKEKGINVHLMSDILPNYEADAPNAAYRLHERDAHPNALANELVAQYVVRQILAQPEQAALN
jgi:hypothetical protein